ncbi:MAG: ATP-binding protein [Gammaproteobacteria bacterium]|nr:ATP-binding protein [Gammaproteobacteria bacterium]
MTFNRDFAKLIVNQGDRDVAHFVAGREAEIARFDSALRESSGKRQAVFRIFQGAPGCGKTSLAAHLRTNRTTGVLFVSAGKGDLKSRDALFARVADAIDNERSRGGKVAQAAARPVAAWLKIKPIGDAAADFVADMTAPKPTLVLHMDEAQLLDQEQDALVHLHTDGLDLPTVCLFTGLSHTESRIRALGGLSRLAKNVTTNMGRMADAECAESTVLMLDRLGVEGADTERQKAVQRLSRRRTAGPSTCSAPSKPSVASWCVPTAAFKGSIWTRCGRTARQTATRTTKGGWKGNWRAGPGWLRRLRPR